MVDDNEIDFASLFTDGNIRFDAARQAKDIIEVLLSNKFITEKEHKTISKRIDKEFKIIKEKHGIEPCDTFKKITEEMNKEPFKCGCGCHDESPFDFDENTPGRISNPQDV